jgi:hypothetical protein
MSWELVKNPNRNLKEYRKKVPALQTMDLPQVPFELFQTNLIRMECS